MVRAFCAKTSRKYLRNGVTACRTSDRKISAQRVPGDLTLRGGTTAKQAAYPRQGERAAEINRDEACKKGEGLWSAGPLHWGLAGRGYMACFQADFSSRGGRSAEEKNLVENRNEKTYIYLKTSKLKHNRLG